MIKALAESVYRSIVDFEMFILTRYKIDPFQFFKSMTVLDMQFYSMKIQSVLKEENKKIGDKDFLKGLIQIRDILNFMTLK
jgi:hypothetical protein